MLWSLGKKNTTTITTTTTTTTKTMYLAFIMYVVPTNKNYKYESKDQQQFSWLKNSP